MAHVENPDDYYGGWKDPKEEKWNRKTNSYSFPMPEFKYVGMRHLGRPDCPEKISGTGIYGRDVYLKGQLYAKSLTSPYANATILSMDTSKAEALPGVRCVLRYDDPEWGAAIASQIKDAPNHEGQQVGCAVAADSLQIVDEALKLVEIVWEERTPLVDWDDAPEDKVLSESVSEFGDIEAGLAEADRTVTLRIKRNNTVWAGTEGLVCTANWRGDRYLDVYVLSQWPIGCLSMLSSYWPICRIHIHAPFHGSQFGGQNWGATGTYYFPIVATVLAKITGKPVKYLYDGSHFDGGSQSDGTLYFTVGMKEDGTITAIDNILETPFGTGGHWLHKSLSVKNGRFTRRVINVNQGGHPCWKHGGAYVPYEAFSIELVATELGMDPLDVRIKNDGTLEHDRAWVENFISEYGFDDRWSLVECIDACKQSIDWDNKWHAPGAKILPNGKYHGMGFTCSHQWTTVLGSKGGSYVGLALHPDGSLRIIAMRGDQGTGWQGSAVRAAADEMGMLYEDVDWEGFHDEQWFRVHDEGCSGGTISIVMGICKAARKLKQWALEAATYSEDVWIAPSFNTRPSLFPDLTPEEMDIKDSIIFEKANPENSAPLSAVVNRVDPGWWGGEYRRGLFDWGRVKHTDPVLDPDEFPEGYPYLCMEVQVCEVEVDPETGKVDVIQGAVANDVGKAFDPEALEQQQFGGFAMGYSRSAIEEQIYDPLNGVQLTDNLIGYPIALMNDAAHAEPFLIETGQGYGPYGASGCGETPAAAAQCVVTTAIHNAIGKWVDMPHTPMRILKALGKV